MAEKTERFAIFRKLREPAALTYLILLASGLFVYFMMMSSRGNDAAAILAIVLAIPGVLARWSVSPYLLLIITTYTLFDPAFYGLVNFVTNWRYRPLPNPGGFNFEDLMLAMGVLAYIIGHFRLISFVKLGMPEDPTPRRPVDPENPSIRPPESFREDELPKTLVIGGIMILVGQLFWILLVQFQRASSPTFLNAGTLRVISLVWFSAIMFMVISLLLTYVRTQRMSHEELDMTIRDLAFHENRRETDRIHHWRRWFKAKIAKKRRIGK